MSKKLDIEFIRAEFAKEGYELLTEEYRNCEQKLDYICPKGHRHSIIWINWKKGHKCPYCVGVAKPTIEFIRSEFKKEDYELLTKIYKGSHSKLDYICPKGHKHSISWNSWQQGQRCSKCSNNISKWEKIIGKFLDSLYIDYISNDRTQLINPKTGYSLELDLWFPDLNKAIECNGSYWHSKNNRKECDKIKQQLCKDQGIDLLVITDKEWNDDINKCKNKIQNFFC